MKPKTLILLVVAGGCGLVAMLGVQQAMKARKAVVEVETKSVLVAMENIETGSVLTPERVTFREIPVDNLPAVEELILTEEQYAERGARIPLFAGDLITLSKLTEPGGTGNSVKIPKGMRVITIPVTETNTQSNLVSPGDRVDVLVTYQSRSGRRANSTKTKTLLEYVEVFATNATTSDKISSDEKSGRTSFVSLLLMPEQVNYVKLAESKGNLSLSWRHKLDDEFVQIRDIDEELLEELEGTIGINERQPLYSQRFDSEFQDIDEPVVDLTTPDEPDTAIALVQQAAVPEPEPVVIQPAEEVKEVKEEEKPQWTLHVYNGNAATPHSFEIEVEPVEEETAQKDGKNPIADTVRSLLGGG